MFTSFYEKLTSSDHFISCRRLQPPNSLYRCMRISEDVAMVSETHSLHTILHKILHKFINLNVIRDFIL